LVFWLLKIFRASNARLFQPEAVTRVPPRLTPSPNGINPELDAIVVWQSSKHEKVPVLPMPPSRDELGTAARHSADSQRSFNVAGVRNPLWNGQYRSRKPPPDPTTVAGRRHLFGKTNVPYMLPKCTSSAKRECI
jgi:hypothetical protein